MLKTASDSSRAAPPPTPAVDPRKGTEILPMPDQSPMVAGMPRQGRAIEPPGDPGVITPEDDVLDTSHENRKR
ncbi:MAG: hypothetical protein E2602_13780 [Achromobacter sp.]|uniref:Uncharacterized protein n=1 Tax=Achromobacter pulmonis TaxID=1389932 RepID=A0A6S7EA34_9BURK|nr:hypothetical protein [Achromobacter pulmonis]MCF7766943.1 hypothetical protein [Achromobacter pulmonis]MPT27944.1 hypothetical protein [Achromobacter sp.]CAB3902392.1 hypothetical protein LMG26788_04347 [Achromobacter pulmonis]